MRGNTYQWGNRLWHNIGALSIEWMPVGSLTFYHLMCDNCVIVFQDQKVDNQTGRGLNKCIYRQSGNSAGGIAGWVQRGCLRSSAGQVGCWLQKSTRGSMIYHVVESKTGVDEICAFMCGLSSSRGETTVRVVLESSTLFLFISLHFKFYCILLHILE